MSILGDQLIPDKLVALVEIVKNSYDADATVVTIRFCNWGPVEDEDKAEKNINKDKGNSKANEPYIEIIDDGNGMNESVLLDIFLNPGTPNKLLDKQQDRKSPVLKRTMQGEKGIGRFAINKLGKNVTLLSKTAKDPEIKLNIDFSEYDAEDAKDKSGFKFLSEIENEYEIHDPPTQFKGGSGTLIRIRDLKQNWSQEDFDSLALSLQKLIAPPDILQEEYNADTYDVLLDFEFKIFVNDKERAQEDTDWKSILKLAPFQMIGTINSKGVLNYTYKCGEPFREREDTETIDLLKRDSYSFSAPAVKNRFLVNKDGRKLIRIPQQGDISFSFYVYDLRPKSQVLNKRQKDFINTHNVFVFRDGIRVYPFGEKDYDWLELSQRRATEKAGWYYNVNQIIGFVYITGKGNPKLKDTTSRYGMMDVDGAYQDFQALTLGALNAMKAESDLDIFKDEIVKKQNLPSASDSLKIAYASLTNEIIKENNPKLLETANQFLQTYDRHSALINERLETYEDLAGLGLAVEKSSHDAIMVLGKLFGTMRDLRLAIERKGCLQPPIDGLLEDMKGAVDIVYNEMQIIQPLFRQSRRTKSIVNVKEVVEKTIRYFRHDLSGEINVDIQTQGDLLIHTAQGLVLQVLINLIDNAIFWLKEKGPSDKKILIKVDGFNQTVLVADNGIGIDLELSQPIFEAFFSRKDSGRGLGLYIVRELLARIGASITLVNGAAEKALPGANFLIQFDTDPA